MFVYFQWPTRILTTSSSSLSCIDPIIEFGEKNYLDVRVTSGFLFPLATALALTSLAVQSSGKPNRILTTLP